MIFKIPDMKRANTPFYSLLPIYAPTLFEKVIEIIKALSSFSGMIPYIYTLDRCLVLRKTGLIINDEGKREHAAPQVHRFFYK